MRYLIALIVLVGGAVLTSAIDRVIGVEVKSPSSARRVIHSLVLMAQGGAIIALVLHW